MVLTEKCKDDFNKWNYDNDFGYIDIEPTSLVVHFENLDDNLKNTVIIDFFDSVGIYIEIECCRFNDKFGFDSGIHFDNYKNYCSVTDFENIRKDAITKAIKKANELYNTNNIH